jgi:hypothetical protein
VVDEAIEDRVAERRIADDLVPVVEGELTRHERGAPAVAVLEYFQKITPLGVPERGKAEVVDLCGAAHKWTHVDCPLMWSLAAPSPATTRAAARFST